MIQKDQSTEYTMMKIKEKEAEDQQITIRVGKGSQANLEWAVSEDGEL